MPHTPGPWTKHPMPSTLSCCVDNSNGEVGVYQTLTFGSGKTIIGAVELKLTAASYGGYPWVSNAHELAANFALICAAPDLLEAARNLLDLRVLPISGAEAEAFGRLAEAVKKATAPEMKEKEDA